MICVICNKKLKCQESVQFDNLTRTREYCCINCKKVFISIEKLEPEPIDRRIRASQTKYFEERTKNA
jgi:hypothetical protein